MVFWVVVGGWVVGVFGLEGMFCQDLGVVGRVFCVEGLVLWFFIGDSFKIWEVFVNMFGLEVLDDFKFGEMVGVVVYWMLGYVDLFVLILFNDCIWFELRIINVNMDGVESDI